MKNLLLLAIIFNVVCGQTIVELAQSQPNLSQLVNYVVQANLVDFLNNTSPLTVFAPTNDAFDALPQDVKDQLTNTTVLASVLAYHVVQANVSSSQIQNNAEVTTASNAQKIRTNVYDVQGTTVVTINGVRVVTANVYASNGVVHIIEKVLLPPTTSIVGALDGANFATLKAAVVAANLVGVFNGDPYTVFAPTNTAFSAFGGLVGRLVEPAGVPVLTKILTYHVASGALFSAGLYNNLQVTTANTQKITITTTNGVRVNGYSTVTTPDVLVTDGVIHVIDQVLLPEFNVYELNWISNYTTLNYALDVAGLNGTLKTNAGPLTVFAPTNDAFAAIPAADLNALLNNPTELTKVLTYHVVGQRLLSSNLTNNQVYPTLNTPYGIRANIYGSTATLNCARVVSANIGSGSGNIRGSNGIVHGIDKVLMPVTENVVEKVINTASLSTLLTAVQTANLVGVLNGTGPFTVFAPTNEAFAALGNTLDDLLAKPDELAKVLLYHVVPGFTCSAGLSSQEYTTAEGSTITVSLSGNGVTINGDSNVVTADIVTTNAVVHVINKVLIPPTPAATTTGSGSMIAVNFALLAVILAALLF